MTIVPQSDYILLVEVEEENKAGLIIPDHADIERTLPGEVIAVGAAVRLKLKVGDLVLFKRHLFDEIVYNDQKYLFGKESSILAILQND